MERFPCEECPKTTLPPNDYPRIVVLGRGDRPIALTMRRDCGGFVRPPSLGAPIKSMVLAYISLARAEFYMEKQGGYNAGKVQRFESEAVNPKTVLEVPVIDGEVFALLSGRMHNGLELKSDPSVVRTLICLGIDPIPVYAPAEYATWI